RATPTGIGPPAGKAGWPAMLASTVGGTIVAAVVAAAPAVGVVPVAAVAALVAAGVVPPLTGVAVGLPLSHAATRPATTSRLGRMDRRITLLLWIAMD